MMRDHVGMLRFGRVLALILDIIFPPRPTELLVRHLPGDALTGFLAPETRTLSSCAAVALLPYDELMVRACIVEAKFHGNRQAVALLAYAAAEYLGAELPEQNAYAAMQTVMLPVPLSRARMQERGYNQAERIARQLAGLVPDTSVETDLLMRVRDTRPQTELGAPLRTQNVRGAFAASRAADPRIRYLILDDVMTTGATMQEAVRALHAAGGRRIMAVALAH